MGKLKDSIHGFEHYEKSFAEWEATELIIDEKRAFWMLKAPDSNYRKVCLYRDSQNMYIYGDYGTLSFDNMTWDGTVHNLEYNNIGYQMEKLSRESTEATMVFDNNACEKDLYEWMRDHLESEYDLEDSQIHTIEDFIDDQSGYCFDSDINELLDTNKFDRDMKPFIEFVVDAKDHIDEYEWIAFLRGSNLDNFDETCESSLWNAGRIISQKYFINMYALQICGEKLKAAQDNQSEELEIKEEK